MLEKGHDSRLAPFSSPSNRLATAWKQRISWKSRITTIVVHSPPLSESASPNGRDLSLNFDNHYYLSLVFYFLSNKHHRSYYGEEEASIMSAIFEMTFKFVSRNVLLTVFQSRLPSIRAAWEELLFFAGHLKNREAFRVLTFVGIDNDWLDEARSGHLYLYHAAQNNCGDLVNTLLARGCRPDSFLGDEQYWTAIVLALKNGDLDSARIMIQHCQVNDNVTGDHNNFTLFIRDFDETDEAYHYCLDLFLEQGADVDYKFINDFLWNHRMYWSRLDSYGLRQSRPWSILDYAFYFHRPIFPKMADFSKVSQYFVRSKALWCLEQGVHILRKYLQESLAVASLGTELTEGALDSTDVPGDEIGWLEILLVEHLLLATYILDRTIYCNTVRALLEVGADLKSLATRKGLASDILYATARLITSEKGHDEEDGRSLMQILLDQDFKVEAGALQVAITLKDDTTLKCLARYCSDLREHGTEALLEAVSNSNIGAIELLLDGGVDPDSAAGRGDAETQRRWEAVTQSNFATMEYLAGRGFQPWKGSPGDYPSDLLAHIFIAKRMNKPDLFAKVEYIIEEHMTMTEPFYPSAYLLDTCLAEYMSLEEGKKIFEYLLKKGARLRPGSPLASWIAAGGGHQLVGELLKAGVDVNAYSSEIPYAGNRLTPLQAAAKVGDYTLVCLLLERGANLNQPVLDQRGTTALQEICAWDPVRPEERRRKEKITRLFLDRGADVNDLSSKGRSALFCAAEQGDLSTAFLLLQHGAKSNAICRDYYCARTALDVAAERGRLDMVDFLLNANALSASALSDDQPYDGAIDLAWRWEHFTIVEMIRKHSADRKRDWAAAHAHGTGTTTLVDAETQRPVLQSNLSTAHEHQAEGQYTPGSMTHDFHPLESGQVLSVISSCVDDSTAGLETEAEGMAGVETTGPNCAHVIEEIEDDSLLADLGHGEAYGENEDSTADHSACPSRYQASSGTGGGLHQPEGQVWDVSERRDDRQVLDVDIFMGFSEYASP